MEIKFLTNQPGPEGQYPINLYLSRETDQGRPALRKVPGLIAGYDYGGSYGVRAMMYFGSDLYTVTGNKVLRYSTYTVAPNECGTLTTSTGTASLATNGTYVVVADGAGLYYIQPSVAYTLNTVSGAPANGTVCYMDGYFFCNKVNDDLVYFSALDDPTSWPVGNVIHSNARGDACTRVISDKHKIWCINTQTTEAFYNTGDASFPIQRIEGSILEVGTETPRAAVVLDNMLYMVDQHRRVIRCSGFEYEVVSTQDIEADVLKGSLDTNSAACGMIFEGNPWYIISGTSAYNKTWAYNPITDSWFQWSAGTSGGRATFACGAFSNGLHVVGEAAGGGQLFALSSTTYTNASDNIKCQRVAPMISNEGKNIRFHRLELDVLSGLSSANPETCSLAYSDDRGQTWSSELAATLQATGLYGRRLVWRRLGASRQRTFRFTYTGTQSLEIYGAYLTATSEG